LSGTSIRYITYRQSHHSPHSGYDRLAQFSGEIIQARPLSHGLVRNRLMWWIANGVIAYDRTALATEIKAAWHMLKDNRAIYHILYGENTYHYLGWLNNVKHNRLVATFHLPPGALREMVRIDWHLRRLSAIVCVGRTQIEHFSRILSPERVFFVPHGIDTDFFSPPANFEERDPNLCLFVGSYLRDFPTLRGVIELVAYRRPQVRFVAVTSPQNYDRIGKHPNLILKSAVSEEDLLSLYRRAAVFIIPMLDATGNNALLEGLACGLPIVISDVGSVRDYASEESAVLVPAQDARRMADEVEALLDDPGRREALSVKAREQALRFSWPEIFRQMQNVYDRIG